MTNPIDPAYPIMPKANPGEWAVGSLGLTKREHFAAMAMQGFLANPQMALGATVEDKRMSINEAAVFTADALIAELNKTELNKTEPKHERGWNE
jgi:hypothetical protein